MNLKRMYREYEAVCEIEERARVKEHMFRDIFNTEFNIHFKQPQTDTCKTCDGINSCLKNEKLSYTERTNYEEQLKSHQICVEEKKLAWTKQKEAMVKLNCLHLIYKKH